jgi:anhydro-N-acetylmuramic acid kinase
MLVDALVAHFTHDRQRYDKDARLAHQGRSIPALIDELMRDPYLKLAPPKSTGREYYGRTYLDKILALGRRHQAKPNDLIRAATVFTALSIVDALNRFVLPKTKIHQLIISGGGAQNPLILAQLAAALSVSPGTQVVGARFSASQPVGAQLYPERSRGNAAPLLGNAPPSSKIRSVRSSCHIEIVPSGQLGVPEDAKEAFAFALLAYETFHRRPSNVPSATGARRPAILGKISYAPSR